MLRLKEVPSSLLTLLFVMFIMVTNSIIGCAENIPINYKIEVDEYGNSRITGFEYEKCEYTFKYDERDIIEYIYDESGNPIAYYCCDDSGNISGVYSYDVNGWELNKDTSFLGNVNKVRWLGYEYDNSSECYLIGDRYFSVQEQRYVDGVDNGFAYSEVNPFLNQEDGIMLIDSYDSDLAAEEWSNALLEDSSFGKAISYSANWYSSLSSVEILARCIYCEAGIKYVDEGNAVARVILNRINDSDFSGSPREVVLQSNQFASITGNKSTTDSARTPSTSSSRWENATYLACLLLTTTDKNEWISLMGNTIGDRLYFYSYTAAKNNGGIPFSGNNVNSLYYNSSRIQDVYVLGYGSVSSFNTLFANYSPTAYSRNIFYNYCE